MMIVNIFSLCAFFLIYPFQLFLQYDVFQIDLGCSLSHMIDTFLISATLGTASESVACVGCAAHVHFTASDSLHIHKKDVIHIPANHLLSPLSSQRIACTVSIKQHPR